jgi:hypothetical protein
LRLKRRRGGQGRDSGKKLKYFFHANTSLLENTP